MKKINEPELAGWELGWHLQRFFEQSELQPERCKTCAFRSGTYANGCVSTVMDATKCVMEGVPFMCHEEPHPCAGNVAFRAESNNKVATPWQFSDEIVSEEARKP